MSAFYAKLSVAARTVTGFAQRTALSTSRTGYHSGRLRGRLCYHYGPTVSSPADPDPEPPNTATSSAEHVALLRAVNVGGRNRVAMAQLRELLSGLGYGDVRTHLQSGNAVFTAAETLTGAGGAPDRRCAESELGLAARVLVRTRAQLQRVVAENPLLDVADDHARLLVVFLSGEFDRAAVSELAPADLEPDVFALASGRSTRSTRTCMRRG